jgi:hypothetical protein
VARCGTYKIQGRWKAPAELIHGLIYTLPAGESENTIPFLKNNILNRLNGRTLDGTLLTLNSTTKNVKTQFFSQDK